MEAVSSGQHESATSKNFGILFFTFLQIQNRKYSIILIYNLLVQLNQIMLNTIFLWWQYIETAATHTSPLLFLFQNLEI